MSFALSLYLIGVAFYLRAPSLLLRRLAFNVLLDQAVGLVPVVGDLLDFGVKSNRLNLTLLERWVRDPEGLRQGPPPLLNQKIFPFLLRALRARKRVVKAGSA